MRRQKHPGVSLRWSLARGEEALRGALGNQPHPPEVALPVWHLLCHMLWHPWP